MNNLLRLGVVFFTVGVLAACGGSSGPDMSRLTIADLASLKSSGKAIVILSSTQRLDAPIGIQHGSTNSSWSRKGKGASGIDFNSFIALSGTDAKTPHIAEVKPGKYNLLSFSFSDGTLKATNMAGMNGLPLATFSVKAGEVVYVGNLMVKTQTKFLGGLQKKFTLAIGNHQNAARAYLTKYKPKLAPKMTTRLMKLSPLLALLAKK